MKLYIYDGDGAFCASIEMTFDYQAEQWVLDIANQEAGTPPVTAFILCDKLGMRCVWARSEEEAAARQIPTITKVTTRFGGDWERTVIPVVVIEAVEPFERLALAKHLAP